MSDNPLSAWWQNALNSVGNAFQPQRSNPLASLIASNPVGTSVVAPQLTNATPIDTRTPVQRQLADAAPLATTMALGMTGTTEPVEWYAHMGNPNFARWFGGSKVVDASGSPMMVYHQTATSNVPSIYDQGFSTNPAVARARLSDEQVPNGVFFKPDQKNIGVGSANADDVTQIPAYLSIKNPLVLEDRDALESFMKKASDEYANHSSELKSMDSSYSKKFDELWNTGKGPNGRPQKVDEKALNDLVDEWTNAIQQKASTMRGVVDDVLSKKGYDGLILNNDAGSMGRKTKTFVALQPTQIKSPQNNGYFNPSDPRIMYGAAGLAGASAVGAQNRR